MTLASDAKLDVLAEAYARARAASVSADEVKKVARDALAKAVRTKGKIKTSKWSVVCAMQTRSTLDLAKVRLAFDCTPFEVRTEVETLRVTALESL